MSGARATMTMRATIERDAAAGADGWGGDPEPDWQVHLAAVACRVWYQAEREVFDANKAATVEDRRAIFPLGTDVTEGDRLVSVTDRLGNVLFAGPIRIESVGRRTDHLALMLEEIA